MEMPTEHDAPVARAAAHGEQERPAIRAIPHKDGGFVSEGHEHSNPYNPVDDPEGYRLFEATWAKKTTMGNFMGWVSSKNRQARERRVQQRVETFRQRRGSFIRSNDLPLQSSYAAERDKPDHPYTGMKGRGEHVNYLDQTATEGPTSRSHYGVRFNRGTMVGGSEVRTPHQVDPVPRADLSRRKVLFTRRGSTDEGSLSAMIKENEDKSGREGEKRRTQHSTPNAGRPVANAGYLRYSADNPGVLDEVELASGHYAPDADSGVKLRMWANAQTPPAFSPQVRIIDHGGKQVDTGEGAQVNAVAKWAEKNPRADEGTGED